MRIAFLSPGWPAAAFANGIVTYIELLREGLHRLGVDTAILAAELEGSGHGSSVVDVRECRARFPQIDRVKRRIMSRIAPQAAGLHTYAFDTVAGLRRLDGRSHVDLLEMEESFGTARLVAKRTRKPLVVRLHGPCFLTGLADGSPHDGAFRRRLALERRAIANARALTSPSAQVLKSVRDAFQLELPHAEVIHNPAPVVDEGSRWRLDKCDANTVLFVGRFDRTKGGDLVINAFAEVAEKRPELTLVVIGPDLGLQDGAGGRVSLPEYLDRAVADLTVRARIQHLGQVSANEIPRWRRRARVTIVASRFEVLPMVVLEAMAFGSPLVAARVGGIPEIVRHGSSGFLFDRGDPRDLAHWLDTMLDDPAQSARLGEQAARDAGIRLGPDAIARQMRDYYERVIADHGRASTQ